MKQISCEKLRHILPGRELKKNDLPYTTGMSDLILAKADGGTPATVGQE